MEGEDYGPGKFMTALVIIFALGLAFSVGAVLAFNLTPCFLNCGGGAGAAVTVILPNGVGSNQSLNFDPAVVTVVIGNNSLVQWVDKDSIPHTVTSSPGTPAPFDSKTMTQNGVFTFDFTIPGTYNYYCRFHQSYMRGTIIVKAASP